MAFAYCIPENQELLPSPSPFPFSTLLTLKETRNKIKSCIYSTVAGGTVIPQGKPDISTYCLRHHQEPFVSGRVTKTGILPRRLMRYLRRILPAMQHRLFVPVHQGEMRLFQWGEGLLQHTFIVVLWNSIFHSFSTHPCLQVRSL